MDGERPEAARAASVEPRRPPKRLGQPEDIAGVVSSLAGPDSAWLDGGTIGVNGGVI